MYPCMHVSSEDSLLFERKSLERLRRRQRMSRWAHRPTDLYRLSLPCLSFKTFHVIIPWSMLTSTLSVNQSLLSVGPGTLWDGGRQESGMIGDYASS